MKVKFPEEYPGTDLDSLRRAVTRMQTYSAEVDTIDVSAAYTVVSEDDLVLVTTGSSAIAITLPFIDDAQRKHYYVKKIDSGTGIVTVSASTGETIDGGTVVLVSQYDVCAVVPQRSEGIPTPIRTWWTVPRKQTSRLRSLTQSFISWRPGASPATLITPGIDPEGDAWFFNAAAESIRTYVTMPIDWDKSQDVTLRMLVNTFGVAETDGDDLVTVLDYVVGEVHTVSMAAYTKAGASISNTTTFTTAKGLVGAMYYVDFILSKDNINNGWAPGDLSDGFGFEFELSNTIEIADMFVTGSKVIYTALY